MKITTPLGSSLMACGLALSMLACNTPPPPSASEVDLALHQDYGALTEADEDEDFGDAELATAEDLNGEEDVAVTDDTADSDPDVQAAATDTTNHPARLRIAVMWGHLRPDFEATDVVDWSGTLSAQNAGLRIIRTLRFEAGDRLQRRPDVHTIPFVSRTLPAADGLLVEVILHPRLVNAPGEPVVLTLDTAAYTGSLVLRRGMRGSHVERVDEAGNAVAYHIFRRSAEGCDEGLLVGRYTDIEASDDGRQLGEIRGKYMSFDGSLAGKIKGIYGKRQNGKQVFFAKVIGRDGAFKGILGGRYGNGKLKGRFIGKARVVRGVVQGLYREAREERGGGFFMGRWSLGCGELSSEGDTETSDEDNAVVDAEVADDVTE